MNVADVSLVVCVFTGAAAVAAAGLWLWLKALDRFISLLGIKRAVICTIWRLYRGPEGARDLCPFCENARPASPEDLS